METSLLNQLLDSPKLKMYLNEIQQILSEEEQKRIQFYKDINEDDKAEFINGEIIHHTPVKIEHSSSSQFLLNLIFNYVQIHDLGFVGHEKILISLTRNDYEPDISYFKKEISKNFKSGQVRFPAPDFIVEVLSPSMEKIDREIKFEDYAAHNVMEYWIVDPETQFVEQYTLQKKAYQLIKKSDTGVLKSAAIPGFEIPIPAIFDRAENLNALKSMLK